jgi:PleD family two-component response regulator
MLVEQSRLPLGETTISGLTISAGATLAEPGEDLEAIIKRADMLLYESKAAGRNRVTAALIRKYAKLPCHCRPIMVFLFHRL